MQVNEQLALRRLKHEYCHTVDDGDYEDWAALFTPDGTFERVGGEHLEGRDALLEMMTNEFDGRFEHTAHVVANPVIDVDGETATGSWYITFIYETADGATGWNQGIYVDAFRQIDGRWFFEDVTVEFDISS